MDQSILIIADDLTGALDSGVAFAEKNRRVCVARNLESLPNVLEKGAEVICVNTQSREGSVEDAVAKIQSIAAMVDFSRFDLIIKKVDSRLKGHVHAETQELMRQMRPDAVLVAPAIPEMGRMQVDGKLFGDGLASPIVIENLVPKNSVIPNIQSDVDLRKAISQMPKSTLWIGARALAFALSEHIAPQATRREPQLKTPFLFAIGSRDPITVAQVERLAQDFPVTKAPNGALPKFKNSSEIYGISIAIGEHEIPANEAGEAFAKSMAGHLMDAQPAAFLVSGGETANAILQELRIDELEIEAEIAPGVPLCKANAPWGEIAIITKSGGFGDADFLRHLANNLATIY